MDRLDLWVYPLVLGTGKQVFGAGAVPTALRLVRTEAYDSGTVQLQYETNGAPTYGDMTSEGDEAARLGPIGADPT